MAQSEDSVIAWNCNHVAQWLQDQGFGQYVELLCTQHRLDGLSLLALTEADLRGPPLGLTVLGDIKRLAIALRRLQRHNQLQLEELGLRLSDSVPAELSMSTVGVEWSRDRDDRRRYSGGDRLCNGTELRLRNNERSRYVSGAVLCHTHSNGRSQQRLAGRLDPEVWKTVISSIYVFFVFGFTSFVMVIVHERVPDTRTYPPLPDIFLDSVPRIPWAFAMAEACGLILCYMFMLILLLHKHRSILLRRLCSLMGTVFLLRCCTMFVTSLSVPGQHLKCASKTYGDTWGKIQRALTIWTGFGMTLTGVQTCGDYMFSGHTVVITMLNFFVTEYTPRNWNLIHTISWVLNLFGIFFILAAHEHYSIDVFIAFYITTRLFLYYHTLANTRAYQHSRRARIWFPMFSFFECNVNGPVPNQYHWPFNKPAFMKTLIG
ncbi:sphingomyelin synthase-related protein 1-like isoform X2 [Melanotaenia boesemani]|nr:sphingomyelin synthase-related protein 1-like isoform X2 [Melanotaenia boesemani]XP_041865405.1 sphingomyelin synthase-related protein 1-like isoform X2 [Melanotaenia boesemani]XP_041865406.1 sphingomyelin synthase-related protein 1-like isoform X2 [Melanotaenia boesemani]XP_041865407.1 sphingomyelin synthase-related protein 1-like isoform X2 [Melanotaenia boesemani]XP_041865408.1 sphingomyelin synthase-related protein 1-like isoform X2 [Melanotaenia boesemani]